MTPLAHSPRANASALRSLSGDEATAITAAASTVRVTMPTRTARMSDFG
jgi:hypothetical protein